VRIRRLLFLLVPIILGGTIPLHAALGPAPLCLAPAALQAMPESLDVKPPVPKLGRAVANYEPQERDYLIRTIAFEAPDESDEGKAAVAHVILNRKRNGRWGDNIKDVVIHPWQFEPWMTRRKQMEKLSPYDPRYQNAARIADAVLTWTGAGSYRGRNALPQSDSRSEEARWIPAVVGAGGRAANRQAYLLLAY
jgi:Cell Wall Hydrolase